MNVERIVASYHSQRARAFLKKVVASCQRKGLPDELSLPFAQGYLILNGHSRYLETTGQILLAEAGAVEASLEQTVPLEHLTNQFEAMVLKLPSSHDPKLNIWRVPSEEVLAHFKSSILNIIIVAGCSDPCLFCCVDSPSKSVSMPLPVILRLDNLGMRLNWDASEPFYYFDPYFNLDFVDLLIELKLVNDWLKGKIFTHAAPLLTDFGLAAAKKAREHDIPIERLSTHLWHKSLIPEAVGQEPNEYQLERHATMVAQALEYFQPKVIHLIASDRAIHQSLSFPFLIKFYQNRVLSKISPALQARYSLAGFAPAQAAVIVPTLTEEVNLGSHPFELRGVQFIRQRHEGLIRGQKLPSRVPRTCRSDISISKRPLYDALYPDGSVSKYPDGFIGNWL